MSLDYKQFVALAVAAGILVALQRRRGATVDLLFLGGLVIVTLAGVITPKQALVGFAEPAVLTIGALFAIAAGLRTTGVLDWLGNKLLGRAKDEFGALWRLAVTIVPASAFLLNTPLVAMMAPVVVDWCRRFKVSPSRLLIPVSYLTILGGVCTLIGTSTTLVVNGQLASSYPEHLAGTKAGPLTFFELGWAGVPCAVVGTLYMLLIARRLLPNHTELVEQLGEHRREYLLEMLVQPHCRLAGQTVEQAGLRQLPGLFLIEIDREGDIITPVTPHDAIHAGDRLIFTGVVTTIADLEKIPGLVPAADTTYEFEPRSQTRRQLTEAVLSRTSPVIGQTVREANFRQRYNAAIVAVHRNGVRLTNKIGNIALEPGDTLLLQTRSDFVDQFRHNRDFYLISQVGGSSARRHDRALIAAALFVLLIAWMAVSGLIPEASPLAGFTSRAVAALAVLTLMVATRCLTISEARSAVDLQVLITIAAAIGLGVALKESGAAGTVASALVGGITQLGIAEAWRPYVLLAVVYLLGMIFTEMITNIAVAVMLIHIAVGTATAATYDPRPFVIAITLSASLSFITPIGYQTNLMVMGPGGYRPRDFFRVGAPLALLTMITALLIIPQVWPFRP